MEKSIRIYTPFLDLLAEVDLYTSLQYTRDFYGVSKFELHMNRNSLYAEYLQKGNLVMVGTDTRKVGMIESLEITLDEKGRLTEDWVAKGPSLEGIMSRRITVPPFGLGYDRKSGDGETVMKHYVERNFTNPDDPNRKIPQLVIAPNLHRGGHANLESRYKVVSDELEDAGKQADLGWVVYADVQTGRFVFDAVEKRDLTQDNEDGNDPVFFSPEFDTIKSQQFSDSDKELRNYGYVGGQGEGKDRKIVELGDSFGLNRIEAFIDARDVGNKDGEDDEDKSDEDLEQELIDRGRKKMTDMVTNLSFEADILTPVTRKTWDDNGKRSGQQTITPFEYETDFDLGDTVEIVNKGWNVKLTTPITQLKEVYEPGGFRLEGTFGRSRPTVYSKIKDKFDELSGVEKQEAGARIVAEKIKDTDSQWREALTDEQRERIRQAEENLSNARDYTEDYAEKKVHRGPDEPTDHSVIWVDTSDKDHDVWKRYDAVSGTWKEGPSGPQGPRGLQGIQGEQGDQGVAGPKGDDGKASYTHIAYANSADGTEDFSTGDSSGKKYIGMYVDHAPEDSDDPSDYKWTLIKGRDGDDGIAGPKGDDGKTPYFHIAYANSEDGWEGFDTSNSYGKQYIGQYTDFTQGDSDNPDDYKWSKIKGDRGDKGVKGDTGSQGPQGPNKVDKGTTFGDGYDPTKIDVVGRNYVQNSYPYDDSLWVFTHQNSTGNSSSISEGELTITNDGSGWTQWQLYSDQGADSLDKIVGDREYTISGEIKQLSESISDYDPAVELRYTLKEGGTENVLVARADVTELQKGKWLKVSSTSTIPQSLIDASSYCRIILQFNGKGSLSYRKIKLGEGNKETDWTPDPADTTSKLDNAVTTINGKGVTVTDGSFYVKDSRTGLKSLAVFKSNMVKDSSFEAMGVDYSKDHGHNIYDAKPNIPNEWSGWYPLEGTARIVDIYHVSGTSHGATVFGQRSVVTSYKNYVTQLVPLSAGQTFTLSAHFRKAPGHTAGTPRIAVQYQDSKHNRIGADHKSAPHAATSESDVLRYSMTGTTPSGTVWVRVHIYAEDDGGWVMADGVQMVLGDTPAPYNPEESISQMLDGFLRFKTLYSDDVRAKDVYADNQFILSGGGILRLESDGGLSMYGLAMSGNEGWHVRNDKIYSETLANITTSGHSANLFITSSGTLYTISSARKYKLLERSADEDVDPFKLLDIEPKTYFDKRNTEMYADAIDKGTSLDDIDMVERVPGLIAEDVRDAGLELFVEYTSPDDGDTREIQSVKYDRLWTLLIPIVRSLVERISKLEDKDSKVDELERENAELKSRLESVEKAVATLQGGNDEE